MSLELEYRHIHKNFLTQCAVELEKFIGRVLLGKRVDRVSTRAKSIDRFLEKAAKTDGGGGLKYAYPFSEIQDLIGARVIVHYLEDVEQVKEELSKWLRSIEQKDLQPQDDRSFSYFGHHSIFRIPDECRPVCDEASDINFFELQIKTLFQHAWSEAEHDLEYKQFNGVLTPEQRRLTGFAASLAWGADKAFQDIISSAGAAKTSQNS